MADLIAAADPIVGIPSGASEVEMAVDPYFPATIPSVPEAWRGLAAHPKGRNRLFLDGHAAYFRDARLK